MLRRSATPDMDLPQKALQIKEDDNSMANPSFRVYYGGVSVGVPFYTFCENTLPPLTPPPSYHTNSDKKTIKKHSRSSFLNLLFSRNNIKKSNVSTSATNLSLTPSSASWSSLNSSSLLTPRKYHERSRFSSRGSSFDSRVFEDVEESHMGSPTSTLCFGFSRRNASADGLRGCYGVW
ncbi:YLP motif-containing protein [Salix suchowensis]|nr:YLP motif-containing protein [Salix suchowensis]